MSFWLAGRVPRELVSGSKKGVEDGARERAFGGKPVTLYALTDDLQTDLGWRPLIHGEVG